MDDKRLKIITKAFFVKILFFYLIVLVCLFSPKVMAQDSSKSKNCNGIGGYVIGNTLECEIDTDELIDNDGWIYVKDFIPVGVYNKFAEVKISPVTHTILAVRLYGDKGVKKDSGYTAFNKSTLIKIKATANLLESFYKTKFNKGTYASDYTFYYRFSDTTKISGSSHLSYCTLECYKSNEYGEDKSIWNKELKEYQNIYFKKLDTAGLDYNKNFNGFKKASVKRKENLNTSNLKKTNNTSEAKKESTNFGFFAFIQGIILLVCRVVLLVIVLFAIYIFIIHKKKVSQNASESISETNNNPDSNANETDKANNVTQPSNNE